MTATGPGDQITVRPLQSADDAEVALVAERLRLTLAEVVGPERAETMFSPVELVDRVRWHLEPTAGRRAAVFLAETRTGEVAGHTIVRVDELDGTPVGLFATIYVAPAHRRRGVANLLIERGEAWMAEAGMTRAITYTDPGNARLLGLFRSRGYGIEPVNAEFVRASRRLG